MAEAGLHGSVDVVRAAHLLAMGVMGGGALLLALAPDPRAARAYEWLFWAAVGVGALTGVGNLARTGATGPLLAAKLALVLAGLLASLARTTLAVHRRPWRGGYALTALGVAAAALLGVRLAHG